MNLLRFKTSGVAECISFIIQNRSFKRLKRNRFKHDVTMFYNLRRS